MKIAVNARLLLKGKLEGTGWFAYETLSRMAVQNPEHEFIFIFDRPFHKDFIFAENVKGVYSGPPSRHPVLWYIWFNFKLPRLLKEIKPDVFFSPEAYLPLPSDLPMLAVMHDIAYEHFPESVPLLVRAYYRHFMPRFAEKATVLATVSEFSKKDIVQNYEIPEEKIRVVYNGVNETYRPYSFGTQEQTREKWTGGHPYFIFVGGLYPRKNIDRLMMAFDQFRQKSDQEIKLVLVGKKAYRSGELERLQAQLKFGKDIIFTGRVNEADELNRLISSSLAMTYVSLFEGFGVPCLEAMRCGTAVIASHTSSMPEVCGEAALFVDPSSTDSIAEAMQKIASEPELRRSLIEKGRQQSEKFSWPKTTGLLWDALMETTKKNKTKN